MGLVEEEAKSFKFAAASVREKHQNQTFGGDTKCCGLERGGALRFGQNKEVYGKTCFQ